LPTFLRLNTARPARLFGALATVAVLAVWCGRIVAGDAPRWATGSEFQRQLDTPIGVDWADSPLRDAMEGLSRRYGMAMVIDRRVDPGKAVTVSLDDVPLGRAVAVVAEQQNLGICFPGPLVYLGPPKHTARLRTLIEQCHEAARRLPPSASRKLLQARPISWPDFATPKDLLARLAEENGLRLAGLERIPHDLWAAADLPPLPLVDRLCLIAGQFDLTLQLAADGATVALVPIPDRVAVVREYDGGPSPAEFAAKWAALIPGARFKVLEGRIYVQGLVEEHERIRPPGRTAPPRKTPQAAEGEKRYTVRKTRGSLEGVLTQLAPALDIEIRFDRPALAQAGISLEQIVEFDAEQATLDELLTAVLRPAGCAFHRNGRIVEIGPAP